MQQLIPPVNTHLHDENGNVVTWGTRVTPGNKLWLSFERTDTSAKSMKIMYIVRDHRDIVLSSEIFHADSSKMRIVKPESVFTMQRPGPYRVNIIVQLYVPPTLPHDFGDASKQEFSIPIS